MKKKLFAAWVLTLMMGAGLMYLPFNDVGILRSQTTTVETSINADVALDQNIISVVSETGFAANEIVYMDREAMRIVNVDAAGGFSVIRGQLGTRAATHENGTNVLEGPADFFTVQDPVGSCVSTSNVNLPRVNVATGNRWTCKETRWVANNVEPHSYAEAYEEIDDAAYTLTLNDHFVVLTRATAGRTFTLPSISQIAGHKVCIVNADVNVNGGTLQTLTISQVNGQHIGPDRAGSITTTGRGEMTCLVSTGMLTSLTNVGWFTMTAP